MQIVSIVFALAMVAIAPASAWAQEKDDFSKAHIAMYKKIAPSVVHVTGQGFKGSGVVVDPSGYIVTSPTACGVRSTEVTVRLQGHQRMVGTIVGRVPELELVVLKVDVKGLTAVALGDSDAVKLGAITYVFGDSFESIEGDDQVAVSLGVLSARYDIQARTKIKGSAYSGPALETSCAVNPNQDGGALVDGQGRLIGVVSLNYEDSKFTGIAIPINRLRPEIERIIKEHRTGVVSVPVTPVAKGNPGWLGVEVEEDEEGLKISRLFKRGPAEEAGLRKGDAIRAINKQRVMTRKRYDEVLQKLEEGTTVVIHVLRGGKELEITVTLGKKVFY